MAESKEQTVLMVQEPPKTKRPEAAIQADIDQAKAELLRLMPLVEAEREKSIRQEVRIVRAQTRHRIDNPGEPFDPSIYSVPMVPYVPDPELCKRFHRQHYTVAGFEKEWEDGYGLKKQEARR